jgi:hypothetical protein
MVVFTVAEDIEAKIRRLRELGKAGAEPETPPTPAPKPTPRGKLPKRRIGSIRERERKRRIIIGASIIIAIILIASFGVYTWYSGKKARELENAKQAKLRLLDQTFKPLLNKGYGTETYTRLKTKILQAKSKTELEQINIQAEYAKVLKQYQEDQKKKKQLEMKKLLNQTKENKITEIQLQFEPLLAQPLPDNIRAHVISVENSLIQQIRSATTVEEVNATDPTPYLIQLWREYYEYKIDSVPGDYVVLEYKGKKGIYSKEEAKAYLSAIRDYNVLMGYRVSKVQFVKIALLLTRDRVVGGFVEPGAKIMLFAQNTSKQYTTIADFGYVDQILLPAEAGIINLNEQQGSSSSSSSSSNSQTSQNQQSSANAGGTTISQGGSSSASSSSSQSSSQSSSASYYYSVNLGEIMKAISSGKIAGSEEAIKQLQNYGDNLLSLEQKLQLQNVPNGVPFLVIVEVPSVYVPDVLTHLNSIYIGEVRGS